MARRRQVGVIFAAGLALAARGALAADVVLLTSTAPGYAPGMAIALTDHLALPAGASATLLFRSGQMLKLRGPFEGTLERAAGDSREASVPALAEVFHLQGIDASVIGGTRALGGQPLRPPLDDVQVDPQRSASYCLAPSTSVWIARPAAAAAGGAYGLRHHGSVRQLAWPADAARVAWPDDVPIEDGDSFDLLREGTTLARIGFRLIADRFASDAEWVAAGILAGCHEQFAEPLARLGHTALTPELWLTSDRGRAPTYGAGEPVRLTVQSDADGYLYCVLARDGQDAIPLFPAGALDGAHLRAAETLTIPGNRRAMDLRAGPAGAEQVRCWLTERDYSAQLPHGLFDQSAPRLSGDLDAMFGGLAGRLARAALALTIEPAGPPRDGHSP